MKMNIAGKWMLGALLLIAGRAGVAGTLAGSAHDFSTLNWSGGKICVACHTTHNSNTTVADAPLWNHALSAATYTLYTSPTFNAVAGQPGGNSKLCLSCHDGTVAVDSFGGATGTTMISAKNSVGTTLKDDHPIGFTYDATLATTDGSLVNPTTTNVTIGSAPSKTGTITATMLYNGKMECSSCHDVHNTFTVGANGTGMVKISTGASAICRACHTK
jgi:hypothetical protein